MYESIEEALFHIRDEIGLPRFAIADKVICKLYMTDDIKFACSIHRIKSSGKRKIYLVNCPASLGYHLFDLETKVSDMLSLDSTLYYRWTEENTLSFRVDG